MSRWRGPTWDAELRFDDPEDFVKVTCTGCGLLVWDDDVDEDRRCEPCADRLTQVVVRPAVQCGMCGADTTSAYGECSRCLRDWRDYDRRVA